LKFGSDGTATTVWRLIATQIAGIGNVSLVRRNGGFEMVFVVSLIGGLLLLAYCVSRVKAKREAKKSIETLFYTK